MLGWMLKRGENAPPDEVEDAGKDNTQVEQPDTPAPVFAARAFRNALFGTPAVREELQTRKTRASLVSERGARTPLSKPQGILLTPGTGKSRPKRVSFGHDLEPSKTTSQASLPTSKDINSGIGANSGEERTKRDGEAAKNPSDDEWEEEEDDALGDPENYCNHDITIDLNEPHSQSGRYWKEEFEKYQQDAKVEMEKLLRYKQLAKSYAQQKDAEAIGLAEKLKAEQKKVINMEKKIAENASHIISRFGNSAEEASPDLISKLTKQTAMASQYRQRVQDLENKLEEFLEERQEGLRPKDARRLPAASPRTQRTLIETQRELRKARNQTREVNELKEKVSDLRKQLRAAEQHAAKADTEASSGEEFPRAKELRAQLRKEQEESRKKDEEILKLKTEFEAFREESQAHEADRNSVLERAHGKIADLKKEIRTLKAAPLDHNKDAGIDTRSARHEQGAKRSEHPLDTITIKSRPLNVKQPATEGREEPDGNVRDSIRDRLRGGREGAGQETAKVGISTIGAEISEPPTVATMSGALHDRPTLDKPRWQPFVPRSPRNRGYLGEELANQIENGGALSLTTRPKNIEAPNLPALAELVSRTNRPPSRLNKDIGVDLLQDRFTKLGGPESKTETKDTRRKPSREQSKSKLPPERRAAALARIEQRRAEKELQKQSLVDKENVRPA